jgi:flagellin-like hook-associated protein FlgL
LAVVVRSNPMSYAISRSLTASRQHADRTTMQLSTGLRVNKAADDAAGLAVGEKIKAQVQGLGQAIRNARDVTSLIQTAEGALSSVQDMLQRIRTLALQAATEVNGQNERQSLQREVSQLQLEIQRTTKTTAFNGQKLLDGSFVNRRFQIGARQGQEIALNIAGTDNLGLQRLSSTTGSTSLSAATSVVPPNVRLSGQLDTDVPVGSSIEQTGTLFDELGNSVAVKATYTRLNPTNLTTAPWQVTLALDQAYSRNGNNLASGDVLAQGTVTFRGGQGDTGQTGVITSPTPPTGLTGTAAGAVVAGRPLIVDLAMTLIDDNDGPINTTASLSAGSNALQLTRSIEINGVVLDNAGFPPRGTTSLPGVSQTFQVLNRDGNPVTLTLRFARPPVPNDLDNDGVPDDTLPAPVATTAATVAANLDAGALPPGTFDPADPAATSNLQAAMTVFDSTGASHAVDVYFVKTGADAWDWHGLLSGTTTPIATGALTFDPVTGALASATQDTTVRFNPSTPGATQNQLVNFDFAGVTQQAAASSVTSITRNGSARGDGVPDGTAPDPNRWEASILSSSGAVVASGAVVFANDGSGGFVTQSASLSANASGRTLLGTDFDITFHPGSVTAGSFQGGTVSRADISVHQPNSIVVTGQLDTDMAVGASQLLAGSPPPEIRGTDGSLTPVQLRAIRLAGTASVSQWTLQVEDANTGAVLGSQRLSYNNTDTNLSTGLSSGGPNQTNFTGLFTSGNLTSFASGNPFRLNLNGLRRLHDITDPVGPATVIAAPTIIATPPITGAADIASVGPNRLDAQTLTITGPRGTATTTLAAGQSAAGVATAVNNVTGATGVTAAARTVVRLSDANRTGAVTFTLMGDQQGGQTSTLQTASIHAEIVDPLDLTPLAAAINEKSATTGITARMESGRSVLFLIAEDGRDIALGDLTGVNLLSQGMALDRTGSTTSGQDLVEAGEQVLLVGDPDDALYQDGARDSARYGGYLRFDSPDGGFSIRSSSTTGSLVASGQESSRNFGVSQIDIRTIDGATGSLAVLDNALQQVSDLRATLGAVQNRMQATVAQLGVGAENLQTAQSRIVDADVAQQAAEQARTQVVLDAGMSMLAQANQRANIALKLLG